MTREEREAVAQFMRLVLFQFHPEVWDYGIGEMRNVEFSKGDGFEGTSYENNTHLQQAYYMIQAIEKLTGTTENFK